MEIRSALTKEVPSDKHFVLKDGRRLKSLFDLSNSFEDMSDDVFNHHINQGKNDFATWIYHVFNDKYLADSVSKQKTRRDIQYTILKQLVSEFWR